MLTEKQKKFIPELLKTGSINATCKKLKIDRKTYYNWTKEEEFATELKTQQDILYRDSLDKLKTALPDAIKTLKDLLSDNASNIKLRAATAIIDNTVKLIENKEFRERIEALEGKEQ